MSSNTLAMPLHPSMRHPLTGERVRALYVDARGRPRYPIMGAGPEEDAAAEKTAAAAAAAEKSAADAAAKAAEDAKGTSGFPANTAVADMKPAEQTAYWKVQAQKHEGRNKDLLAITGGKYGDDLKAELEAAEVARQSKLSADEKAIEAAEKRGREDTAREYGPKSVRAAFDLLLGDMPEQERNDEIELLDLAKFLNENGDVDTAKVRAFAQKIAPAVKDEGRQRNYGQGPHGRGQASGVASGAEMFAASRNKSTTTS